MDKVVPLRVVAGGKSNEENSSNDSDRKGYVDQFVKAAFSRPASLSRDGNILVCEQDGMDVYEHLLGEAIKGLLSGPLASRFANDPESAGGFAARVVNGAHDEWFGKD